MKMTVFNVLRRDQVNGTSKLLQQYKDGTLKEYVDLFYLQEVADWNKEDGERFNYTRVEAKQCTQEDFGDTKEA